MGEVVIRQAGPDDVDAVARLFDAYRRFYGQTSDLPLAAGFLRERLGAGESVVFVAEREAEAVGFVQLYPAFSSTAVRPRRLWILNDLFVAPEARRAGVARGLMARALRLAEETDACGLELSTARTNLAAQRLYESLGWRRDDVYLKYELAL